MMLLTGEVNQGILRPGQASERAGESGFPRDRREGVSSAFRGVMGKVHKCKFSRSFRKTGAKLWLLHVQRGAGARLAKEVGVYHKN